MNNQVIPEAAVEAAGYAEANGEVACNFISDDLLRAALEAAAPHMLREAQEVAWAKGATSAGMNLMALQAGGINPNPYRSQE